MSWDFELVAGPYGGTSEGPVWDGQAMLFTDIPNSLIMRYDPETGECTEWRTGTNGTNGLNFDLQGRLYGCSGGGRTILYFDPDGANIPLPNLLGGKRHNTPNDLAIDRKGRIWFTDPNGRLSGEEREIDHSSVLRLDPVPQAEGGWALSRMTRGTSAPNGLLMSADERTLYLIQSDYQGVRDLRAYPLRDDDTLGDFTVLHVFGEDFRGVHRGLDGMCLDTEGNIIACGGWRQAGPGPMVYVFSPAGRVLETHPVPVDWPTNCAFGGRGLDTLYVTTHGGHFFRINNTGRRGLVLFPE
ncbi:MAG: SMP-30/gluconolactonase/LRE family protein [Chloroflexota bacterium]|uniref:SMP-30/Gluconolactonase/LRE-like region domain-containing protein n=1 Tax=marine metagenome TaxID=408172 RepID=A0A381QZ50_9ZZZZ|nr:SMP-30/gluconolactonase/LRE family protein [Chloroflexota bacterium]